MYRERESGEERARERERERERARQKESARPNCGAEICREPRTPGWSEPRSASEQCSEHTSIHRSIVEPVLRGREQVLKAPPSTAPS